MCHSGRVLPHQRHTACIPRLFPPGNAGSADQRHGTAESDINHHLPAHLTIAQATLHEGMIVEKDKKFIDSACCRHPDVNPDPVWYRSCIKGRVVYGSDVATLVAKCYHDELSEMLRTGRESPSS